MEPQTKRPPKRKDDRVILQFDYDCFYAQVFENKHPHLKSKPLGIKQKNILATCNYNARAKGVRKLMLITEARKLCPQLVVVEGEDLTPFRDMSKTLFQFLKSHSWNGKAERLGFDEVFMDVTDIIDYNISCVNKNALADSFFFLSQKDPQVGFQCDLTSIAGPVIGDTSQHGLLENLTYLRLLVGSHLAMYLRNKLETEYGYTSTCGIATNKVLSKLAGGVHKPRNQTTLLLLTDLDVTDFMDPHTLRKVPGIGFKMAHLLDSHITMVQNESDSHSFESDVTVGDARLHSDITPSFLETLLAGPGAEKGVGARIWGLLHGVDHSEVKAVGDVPSQISIEDTYKGLETVPDITAELFKLSCSLIRRMRVDLLVEDEHAEEAGAQRWAAKPKNLRLVVRWWSVTGSRQHQDFSRISKSGPLNPFVFEIKTEIEELAQRLVSESLLPMLRRIHAEQNRKWNLQLINICVANMVAGAADDKYGSGRDISVMFRKQDEVLRPWKVVDETPDEFGGNHSAESDLDDDLLDEMNDQEPWHDTVGDSCPICGHVIPIFAKSAHARFHETDG